MFTVEDVVRVAPMIKADEIDYAEAYELVELISEVGVRYDFGR